ncbi:MAG: LuxR C-terminal-related transcriptional regulator [Candidatus Nanopelagicales bacterium]
MLIGRGEHLERIDAMLRAAREGRPSAVRLVGGPGMGKTALLDEAAESAQSAGLRVARFVALEPEQRTPGAALGVLLRHLGSPNLPSTQSALLQALSAASADGPLLLLLDDVHWLDAQTVASVSFAIRRLLVDPVAVLMAGRPQIDRVAVLEPIPRLDVPPLTDEQGVQMLHEVAPQIPRVTAEAVARSLAGVPLALSEVTHLLPEDVLLGRAPVPDPLPVSTAVQDRYAEGFAALDERARWSAVLLAVDLTGEALVIDDAMQAAGLSRADLHAGEAAGLVRLSPTPEFVHPLARAAVHSAASAAEVRKANRILAMVTAALGRDESLRHRAASAAAPDLGLASDLEDYARRLAVHPASRAAAGEAALLAAQFAGDPAQRTRLRLAAASYAGASRARGIVEELLAGDLTDDDRARCLLILVEHDDDSIGQGMFRRSSARSADAASQLDALDRLRLSSDVAVQVDNWRAWLAMETLDRSSLLSAVRRLEARASPDDGWEALVARGQALTFLGDHRRAVDVLRRAVFLTDQVDPASLRPDQLISWSVAPGWLMDDDRYHAQRFRRMEQLLRATGEPENVVSAAFFRSERARREGEWGRAESLLREALELSGLIGSPDFTSAARLACLMAYQGRKAEVDELLESAAQHSTGWSRWNSYWFLQARGALTLTLGDPQQAIAVLAPFRDLPFAGRGSRDHVAAGLTELAEALVATGARSEAAHVAEQLAQRLDGVVDPYGLALVSRSRGLAQGSEALLREAVEHMHRTTEVFETARSYLLLGEHLRRARQPKSAREWLHRALTGFQEVSAVPWVERTSQDLAAAGDRPVGRPREVSELTPQETRVALAVADGLTNAEVAQQLFLSVKTVEFHLGRVFRKLDVRSRGGLGKVLVEQGLG